MFREDSIIMDNSNTIYFNNPPSSGIPVGVPFPNPKTIKALQDEGRDEYAKVQVIKSETDKQIVNNLVKKANRCIISISSKFPWDIFPNKIVVEESRVTFVFNQFLSSQSHSVDVKDISNVFIESTFLLSSLQIVSRTFIQNDIKIDFLDTKEALKVKRIIEGLRTFITNNIDTSNYEIDELINKLEELHSIR
jgi:hypothetical protein